MAHRHHLAVRGVLPRGVGLRSWVHHADSRPGCPGRVHESGPVPIPRVAPGRHGRDHPGQRLSSRRGGRQGRHLPAAAFQSRPARERGVERSSGDGRVDHHLRWRVLRPGTDRRQEADGLFHGQPAWSADREHWVGHRGRYSRGGAAHHCARSVQVRVVHDGGCHRSLHRHPRSSSFPTRTVQADALQLRGDGAGVRVDGRHSTDAGFRLERSDPGLAAGGSRGVVDRLGGFPGGRSGFRAHLRLLRPCPARNLLRRHGRGPFRAHARSVARGKRGVADPGFRAHGRMARGAVGPCGIGRRGGSRRDGTRGSPGPVARPRSGVVCDGGHPVPRVRHRVAAQDIGRLGAAASIPAQRFQGHVAPHGVDPSSRRAAGPLGSLGHRHPAHRPDPGFAGSDRPGGQLGGQPHRPAGSTAGTDQVDRCRRVRPHHRGNHRGLHFPGAHRIGAVVVGGGDPRDGSDPGSGSPRRGPHPAFGGESEHHRDHARASAASGSVPSAPPGPEPADPGRLRAGGRGGRGPHLGPDRAARQVGSGEGVPRTNEGTCLGRQRRERDPRGVPRIRHPG